VFRKKEVAIKDDSDDVQGILSVTTQEVADLQSQLPEGWNIEVIEDETVLPPQPEL